MPLMPNAKIEPVGPGEMPLVTDLYNRVFKPAHDPSFFERRFKGRWNSLMLVASVEQEPVGFSLGFELKPGVFFMWLIGVSPDLRRQGIGSQLMQATEAWATEHEYEVIRFECQNTVRPMLHLAIAHKYDIVGIRWDPDLGTNLVIFERSLGD